MGIVLTIGNSYSTIKGCSAVQEKSLRDTLSYIVGGKAAYYSGFGPRKKSLLDKKGNFPTGLYPRVLQFLVKNQLIDDLQQVSRTIEPRTSPFALPGIKPYLAQEEAVQKAFDHGRGTICMPTGTGKSLVIALIASRLGVKTLVVVPSLEIKKQLQEALKSLKNVTVENIDSSALFKAKGYDCLIIDEAHHVAASTYQKLNKTAWTGIYYRFFMTATPFRNDDEETLLFESIAGQVIYRLDYKTSIANKYIVPIEAYYIESPKQKTDAFTYSQVYSELVVNNEARNGLIVQLLAGICWSKKSVLCLVREVKHGQILSAYAGVPFVSGEDGESRDYIRQFNSGGIKALIGTIGILGEGVDTKPCEYVVIAGLGKAKSQFMQQVGRAVRTFPGKESAKVIIIKDDSHKFTKRHFNAQKKILLEEYDVKCYKLEI